MRPASSPRFSPCRESWSTWLWSAALSSQFRLWSEISKGITLELTLCAISPQKVLLFMRRTLRSWTLWTTNFFKPLGRKNLVVLSEPYPILGIFLLPLNLLLMRLSMPEWTWKYLLVFSSSRRDDRRRGRIGSGWTWGFASWRYAFWGGEWISP